MDCRGLTRIVRRIAIWRSTKPKETAAPAHYLGVVVRTAINRGLLKAGHSGGEMTTQTQAPSADLVALAAELRPLLARNAAQAESDRRLPAENIQVLEDANLFKLMVPRRWDGYAVSLPTAIRTFAELAKGCGSTGWAAMIINGINWWASRLRDRGQEEIFAKPGTRLCAGRSYLYDVCTPIRLGGGSASSR
jgi:alkylation response protein AidB-like acyl-CoA dehydrogenase